MDTQFIAADSGPAAGLINPDRNADLFLRPTQFFAQPLDSSSDDRG